MTREEYYNLIAYHCYLTHNRVGDAYEGQRADFNKLWESTKQRINNNLPDLTITDEHPKNPWISVNDRLPEEGSFVIVTWNTLVFNVEKIQVAAYYHGNWEDKYFHRIYPTHWMPIPAIKED